MRILAWDDYYEHPDHDDLSLLCRELELVIVPRPTFVIKKNRADFEAAVQQQEPYDAFIIDWFDETKFAAPHDPAGKLLSPLIRKSYPTAPIFVYTRLVGYLDEAILASTGLTFPKSKSSPAPIVATDIRETLRTLGLLTDSRKIFLIYGHDHQANGAAGLVRSFLEAEKYSVDAIAPENIHGELLSDISRRMSACAAFIGICTPDDEARMGLYPNTKCWQPRQNVLFEIGIACGLRHGPQRLTLLRETSHDPELTAQLPSDLGGYLSITFSRDIRHTFPKLKERLEKMLGNQSSRCSA